MRGSGPPGPDGRLAGARDCLAPQGVTLARLPLRAERGCPIEDCRVGDEAELRSAPDETAEIVPRQLS
jgi:hypothetical protein